MSDRERAEISQVQTPGGQSNSSPSRTKVNQTDESQMDMFMMRTRPKQGNSKVAADGQLPAISSNRKDRFTEEGLNKD